MKNLSNKNRKIIVFLLLVASLSTTYKGVYDIYTNLQTQIQHNEQLEQDKKELTGELAEVIEQVEDLEGEKEELEIERDVLLREIDNANKKIKELATIKEQKEQSNLNAPKGRSVGNGTPVQMTLTFYGDGADENGGYAGITAWGEKLAGGMVASNVYPKGTQFSFNGKIYTVSDKGGSNFNSYNRLDVFVPRWKNESNSEYKKRISSYGRRTVTMYKM